MTKKTTAALKITFPTIEPDNYDLQRNQLEKRILEILEQKGEPCPLSSVIETVIQEDTLNEIYLRGALLNLLNSQKTFFSLDGKLSIKVPKVKPVI